MTEPQELEVHANGLRFGALAWGDPDAPLALLVHGYPDTAWTWRHLGPALAGAGWRAVAPFTRGYAPTDLAPDDAYGMEEQVADVLALADALGGGERAALVGHDWGSAATWAVATVAPGRFAHLVAMSVPPGAALVQPWRSPRTIPLALRQAQMSWYMAYNQLPGAERTLGTVIPRLWRAWSPGLDGEEDVARVLAALDTPARRRAALRYYRCTLGTPRALAALNGPPPRQPALYLHGADDGCLHAGLVDGHRDGFPEGSRMAVLDGVGHFLQLEDPARVEALVLEWLRR